MKAGDGPGDEVMATIGLNHGRTDRLTDHFIYPFAHVYTG